MTAYLPIQETIQPLNETATKTPTINIDTAIKLNSDSESEGEPEPSGLGDEIASNEETIIEIESVFREDRNLTTKLVKYAQRKILELMGRKDNGLIRPDDILAEALFRLMDGRRKWNRTKQPNIVYQIILVMVSLIRIEADKIADTENQLYKDYESNRTDSKQVFKKRTRIIPLYAPNKDIKQNDTSIADIEKFDYKSLQKIQDDFNYELPDESELISKIETELENDENEFFVFQEMLEGNKSNINIAKKLEASVGDVENARKRIKRKTSWLKNPK